ncbi:MAG: YceD family protein [Gammaproteobacteria bacterium]|nr:YceD family protein [Gammaproteobacteria bacterium]
MNLTVAELPRLQELAAADVPGTGRVCASLALQSDGHGRPELAGRIDAQLSLECQRCLQPLDFPVTVTFNLLCLADESELDALTASELRFDSLVVDNVGLDLQALLEDEILASLPLAPKHDDTRICAAGSGVRVEEPEMTRPFAGLADLLNSPGSSGHDR